MLKYHDSNSRYERVVTKGGISQKVAIQRATAELERMKPRLVGHVDVRCAELEAALNGMQPGAPDIRSRIEEAYECAQDLRDISAPAGLSLIGVIAKSLCEVLELLRAYEVAFPSMTISCHRDALLLAQRRDYRGKSADDFKELVAGLQQTALKLRMSAMAPGDPTVA